MIKVSTEIPPIYQKCHEIFGVNWDDGLAITYGDTVYAKYPLLPDVEAHEGVHIRQQEKIGKDIWWEKYLTDLPFRLEQEIEAYQYQATYIKNTISDRNARFKRLRQVAVDLSSSVYGNMITFEDARKLLM